MKELKDCPFCKGAAAMGLTGSADERSGYVQTYSVYCSSCHATVSRGSATDKNGWANEAPESVKLRVVKAWNRRD